MLLHPQARVFLDAVAALNRPGWEQMPPTRGRQVFNGLKELFGAGPELHRIEDHTTTGGVPIRVYRPAAGKCMSAVMYFHGGGWVLGSIDTHDPLCRRLARESGCVIISVDYRLAPEYRFPAPLEDCFSATQYVAKHAELFGVDRKRLAVCGDSAGGNLAAAVAVKARDSGGPCIHSQWLIYPVIEPRFDTASYREFGEGYGLARSSMQWFWDQYAPSSSDRANPLAALALLTKVGGLPPAHVLTAEFDVLRDEGESFAAKLKAAGVPVTTRRYDGMLHGFLHCSEPFDDSKLAMKELGQAIRTALFAAP